MCWYHRWNYLKRFICRLCGFQLLNITWFGCLLSWQLCIGDTNGIKIPKKVPYFFSSWNPWIPDLVFFFHFRFTAYVDTPLKFFSRLVNIESEIFICFLHPSFISLTTWASWILFLAFLMFATPALFCTCHFLK